MRKYIPWLSAFLIVTLIFGTIYVVLQQSLRLNANQPQIQLAQDAAAALEQHREPGSIVTGPTIDIGSSLAPFIIIYDKSGGVITGSGMLNGQIPRVPFGVLKASEGMDYNFVTWQPAHNVRLASVEVKAGNYYVLSARSLKEVERQENTTLLLSTVGWLMSMLILGVSCYVSWRLQKT